MRQPIRSLTDREKQALAPDLAALDEAKQLYAAATGRVARMVALLAGEGEDVQMDLQSLKLFREVPERPQLHREEAVEAGPVDEPEAAD